MSDTPTRTEAERALADWDGYDRKDLIRCVDEALAAAWERGLEDAAKVAQREADNAESWRQIHAQEGRWTHATAWKFARLAADLIAERCRALSRAGGRDTLRGGGR
jgi:hypothetical protein